MTALILLGAYLAVEVAERLHRQRIRIDAYDLIVSAQKVQLMLAEQRRAS